MVMWGIAALVYIIFGLGVGGLVIIPAQSHSHIEPERSVIDDNIKWDDLTHAEYVSEYTDEFSELFDSYETKWSKNGRLMLRQGDSGPYRFVKKGV